MCMQIDAKTVLWNLLTYRTEVREEEIPKIMRLLWVRTRKVAPNVYLEIDSPAVWAAVCNNPVVFHRQPGKITRGANELYETEFIRNVVNANVPVKVAETWRAVLQMAG